MNYLIEEFGFLLAAPELYRTDKIAYIYHRPWPIFENLVNGKYGQPINSLGFVIVEETGP